MIIPELVDFCNLRCILCWNRNRKGSGKQMSLKTVEKVISVFGGGRWANYKWYNWGEPLLYTQFHEFVEIAKHVRSGISSNFSLKLTNKHFESLAKLEEVVVSLSGLTPEVYNAYHVKGNFNLVMENVKRLIGFPNKIRINWVRHSGNIYQEEAVKEFCEKNNFIYGGFNANCEVEELLEDFTHPFLKTPKQYSSKHLKSCKVQRWIPISVDGEYLLCCTSHNVGLGVYLDDNISKEELIILKNKTELCKTCQKNEYWRMF